MTQTRVIGLLSPGEMGSQVGRVLHAAGADVRTVVEGRSEGSRQRATAAGFSLVPSLEELARAADLILCIVPSSAAIPVARDVAAAIQATGAAPLYCDLNSIGPGTAQEIQGLIQAAGGRFVDGSIIGSNPGPGSKTTFFLSGPGASDVAVLLTPLTTEILPGETGEASSFKVLYAGMTKGVSALGMELLAGAERLGLRDRLMERYRSDHPSVARLFEGTLPGLPPRSQRRSEEMTELADTLQALGLGSDMAQAAERTLARVADRYAEQPLEDDPDLDALLRWWTS